MRKRIVGKQPYEGTYVRAWPCACGKRGYKDRAAAKQVIKEMRRNGDSAPVRLNTYRCTTDPDYWHVGRRFGQMPQNLNDPDAWSE